MGHQYMFAKIVMMSAKTAMGSLYTRAGNVMHTHDDI